jgi:hypothetical protein
VQNRVSPMRDDSGREKKQHNKNVGILEAKRAPEQKNRKKEKEEKHPVVPIIEFAGWKMEKD